VIDTNKKYTPPAKYQPKPRDPNKKPEKVPGFTVLSSLALIAIYIGKYCIDFLLMPALFSNYNTPAFAVTFWIIETIIITFLCIKFITGFGYFYIPACLVYAILVWIWPNGIFGFGEIMPAIAGAGIAYVASRIVERVEMWLFILAGFVRM
jgi:hypothetical protein